MTVRGGECEEVPGEVRTGLEFTLQAPTDGGTSQVSVDGEVYEPVNMHIRLKPKHITIFT